MGSIRLLRNATLVVHFAGKKVLVDPLLAKKEEYDAFTGAGNDIKNPTVDLPISEEELAEIITTVDAVFVTHSHPDHWDIRAQKIIPKDKPIFVQPTDEEIIKSQGFTNITVIADEVEWGDIKIYRTGGQHGFGKVGQIMGHVSGYVLSSANKRVYLAGDTRWCDEVKIALDKYTPDVIVLNAGGAQFVEGEKKGGAITMTPEDVITVHENSKKSHIITVHMEALNHCFVRREDLRNALSAKGLEEIIKIPADGDEIIID